MSFDYIRSVSLARRLITKFGKAAVLVQDQRLGPKHAPTYVPSDVPFTAVDLNKVTRDKSGTRTGKTERRMLIEGGSAAQPKKGDRIEVDGAEHEIDAVQTLNPADTVVLYTVWLVT